MSRRMGTFIGLMAVVALSGCGKNSMDCASNDARSLVAQIAEENRPLQLFIRAATFNDDSPNDDTKSIYTLNSIRMTAKDSTTGALTCAADLNLKLSNVGKPNGADEDITYKLEKTSDNQLYATVYGLK